MPTPNAVYFFLVTAFDDGSAVATWRGLDGSSQKAYLPVFDLRYQGQTMQERVQSTRVPAAPELPYGLKVWSWAGPKDPAVVTLQPDPEEAPTLAKLTSQVTWVHAAMKARVDWLATHAYPLPTPPDPFGEHDQPLPHFFRVFEHTTDSNFDGLPDHMQLGSGGIAFNQDVDTDGIPNGYDADLWSAAQYPDTATLLSSILISEVLLSNDSTNRDDDGESGDWVELYNPTPAAVDLTGWFLSDSSGSSGRMKWTFPSGTTLGSGQFLVIWCTGKNRGGVEDRNGNSVLDPGEDLDGDGELDPPRPIHTSFSISAGNPPSPPEPVVLSRPNPLGGSALIVDAFRPGVTANYGEQRTDVSFGRFPSPTGLITGYFLPPTPGPNGAVDGGSLGPLGAPNRSGALGFTNPPTFAPSSAPPGLYENTTVTATLLPPASDVALHFTTNCAVPTRYSELYSGPITTQRTKVIRVIAVKEGYLPSPSVTRSYLFKEDVLGTLPVGTLPIDHQGARDSNNQFIGPLKGYPESSELSGYPLLYHMHPDVIRDKKRTLSTELSSVPIVSVVSSVPELFDLHAGGIYPNSGKSDDHWSNRKAPDPLNRDWERLCSFEFIEKDKSNSVQSNARLSMTGGSSLYQDVTRKHNLRVKFDSSHGPPLLQYPLFTDFPPATFVTLHLKNPTQDSWSQHKGIKPFVPPSKNFLYKVPQASYCDEGWVRSAHMAMGHDAPRRRWVHLFLNGLYWGPYELTERIDADYARIHAGTDEDAEYDVLKQRAASDPPNPNGVSAIDGTTTAWDTLVTHCQNLHTAVSKNHSLATQDALYAQILNLVDVPNYIDYLLCYAYSQCYDWPHNNFRIVRSRNLTDNRFRFYVWDAEWAFQPNEFNLNAATRINGGGVGRLHQLLLSYSAYRQAFAERIRFHFHEQPGVAGSGVLADTPAGDKAVQLFQAEMAKFDDVLFSESARWGYLQKPLPYTFSDPTVRPKDSTQGDWQRTTQHIVNTWLPQRRKQVFGHLAGANLYVAIAPVDLTSPKVGKAYSQLLTAKGGKAPHTLSLAYGTLPPGLSLNGSTLKGTPTTGGIYTFTLSATSSDTVHGVPRPLTGLTRFTLIVRP